MLARRIVPCLDVKDGQVVKGVQFRNHEIIGDIVPLAENYSKEGADELVFYDISASARSKTVDKSWVAKIAACIDIPFCVAGGVSSVTQARQLLAYGADKISVNSPALITPDLINQLQDEFGRQCVVVGIDSFFQAETQRYIVKQFTGEACATRDTQWQTQDWVEEVQTRGCGEIVLNVMNHDGVREGYDIQQLQFIRERCDVPLIASGGAGKREHFAEVFQKAKVDAALAASVFHKNIIRIGDLKQFLTSQGICIRQSTTDSTSIH